MIRDGCMSPCMIMLGSSTGQCAVWEERPHVTIGIRCPLSLD